MPKNLRSRNTPAPHTGSVHGTGLSLCFKLHWPFVRVAAGRGGQQKAAYKLILVKFIFPFWDSGDQLGILAKPLWIIPLELKHIAGFLPPWLQLPLSLPGVIIRIQEG